MNERTPIIKTDDLDILSGIWIMSCNDDNAIMTYKSVAQRLNRPDIDEIKDVVRSRPELFRQGILNSRLNAWKDLMRSGKSRPNWIVEIHDQTEQRRAIDTINRDDVFRSQFRVEDGATKSDIQVIDWGLQHIERLRKAAAEEHEARSRKWTSIIIPCVSLLVAIVSVVGSIGMQWFSAREQAISKQYEVEFRPKQQAYSQFLLAFDLIVGAVAARNRDEYGRDVIQLESAFFSVEPFLTHKNSVEIRAKYQELLDLCRSQLERPTNQTESDKDEFLSKLALGEVNLRDQIFGGLFEARP